MSVSIDLQQSRENRLLAALSDRDYERLIPHLELVSLSNHQVLYDAGEKISHVYFPTQAMISLVSIMADGAIIEVGIVAKEGMAGMPVCWGGNATINQAMVQMPGTAMRMKAEQLLTEFNRYGALHSLLLRYTQALYSHTTQTAACNRLHTLEERFARWLLTVRDRIESDELTLTQEFISHMLGTRRSGVTVAASTFQEAGMIRYSRGKITILNQENLESAACECYKVIKDEFTRLLGTASG